MKVRNVAITAAIAVAVLLGSCSNKEDTTNGKSTIPKADFIAQTDAVCADANTKLATKDAPGDPAAATDAELAAWSDYLDFTKPIIGEEITKLVSVSPPDEGSDEAGAIFTKMAVSLQDVKDMDTAAKGKDLEAFKAAATKAQTASDEVNKAASDFGLKDCAE